MSLFLELRRHGKLAEKRNPLYEKNKFGKIFVYVMAIFWIGYLIFGGVAIALAFQELPREAYDTLNCGLVFFMIIDFLFRFAFQTTPSQEIKPYLLLPLRKQRLIDFLLIRSGLSGYNLFWLFFFVPFSILAVWKFYGLWGVLTYNIGIWLLMVLNNYWYLLCRTLIGERLWWVLLPLVVYAGIIGLMIISAALPDNNNFFYWSMLLGGGFITGDLLAFAGVVVVIALFWLINRSVIQAQMYSEINKVEDTRVKRVSEYKFLDRYGEIGEYIRLELKLLLRNKVTKNNLRMMTLLIFFFCLILTLSDIYDTGFMKGFILIYNYIGIAAISLTYIMGYEGNYIDGLMSRREAIYSLLRAKYVVYSLALLIPFVLMIPVMIIGKLTLLSCIACMIFTSGAVYFGIFQLAVFNNRTIDLQSKMTGRGNMGTGWQNLIGALAFSVPMILFFALNALFGATATSWVLMIIGAGFMLTSNLWLKNIYHRFMARRYQNMEGFRDSRQR
ncbi:MAG: DUF5687 family protein [Mediterranea sp.]|jgi:hypothetical protein|nr:DUF5687 family protein [Mediterranea sp.]